MLILAIIIFLFFFLWFIYFKRLYNHILSTLMIRLKDLEEQEKRDNETLRILKENKKELEENLEQTISLYEFSKEIRKFFDMDKIFQLFKEWLVKNTHIEEVLFIREEDRISYYVKDYQIKILKIDNKFLGFLAIKGINHNDVARFNILFQQFAAGITGAYLFKTNQELSILDGLTGVFNRRYFLERVNQELERAKKINQPLAFLMCDIDYFKNYNDRYGHLVGDSILREVTKIIKENIRQIDFMGRYGGEEFCAVLLDTDKKNGYLVAERIRRIVESKTIKAYDETIKVTLSIGVAQFPNDADKIDLLIERADQALYQAKFKGRNLVCVWGSLDEERNFF